MHCFVWQLRPYGSSGRLLALAAPLSGMLVLFTACGGRAAAAPAAANDVEANPAPARSTTPASAATVPSEPAASIPTSEPGALSARQLCEQMCTRLPQRCGASVQASCRVNCKQYESPPPGCDADARAAFECARDAADLQCANISPVSCDPKFLRLAACARGEKLDAGEVEAGLPAGWERFKSGAGFSAVMPRGVASKTENGDRVFSVEDGGLDYSVRVREAPPEPATQKGFVKVAFDLLGESCSKKLRLHGKVEHDRRVSIRFNSQCRNGTEWRGLFVVFDGKLYVLAITGPKGFEADHARFFEGFDGLEFAAPSYCSFSATEIASKSSGFKSNRWPAGIFRINPPATSVRSAPGALRTNMR